MVSDVVCVVAAVCSGVYVVVAVSMFGGSVVSVGLASDGMSGF